jgi:gas vesicle protein
VYNINYGIVNLYQTMEVEMRSIGRFLAGFLFGGLVGIGVTLILTPYSGEENRTYVVKYVDHVKEEVQTAMSEKRAELESELAQLRQPQKSLPK